MGVKHKRPAGVIKPKGKQNPFLAEFEAKLENQYRANLMFNSEIDCMVFIELLHDDFKVGPGRAKKYLDLFMGDKMDIAERVIKESEDDNEILVFKRDHAAKLKSIFGKDWDTCKNAFEYLKDYW